MAPRGGQRTFLATTRIRSRGPEKIEGQTNKHEQCLGLTQEQKKSYATLCIPDSIYGLTLAWVTSENSTKQLECRLILTQSSSLDPIFSATVSGVDRICPCPWFHANCLPAPLSNQLSSRVPLPLPATPRFQVQKPFVWFRAKTDKGIICLAGHLYSVTHVRTISTFLHAPFICFL